MPTELAPPNLAQLTDALTDAAAEPIDDAALDRFLRRQIVETHAMLRDAYNCALGATLCEGVTAHLNNAATLAGIATTLRQNLPQSTRNHRLEIVVDRRAPVPAALQLEAVATHTETAFVPPEPDADGRYNPFAFPEESFRGATGSVDAAMMREVCNHGIPLNEARAARGLAPMPGFPPAGAPTPTPSR